MSISVSINTTQNVKIDYETASVGDRVLASLIDQAIITAYWLLVYYLDDKKILKVDETLYVIIQLVPFLYHLLFEVFNNGQSVGKAVMKTRVIRLDGTEPHISDYLIRWLIGMIEVVLTYGGLALIIYLVSGRGQRLGDIAAGTTMAKLKQRVTLEQTLFEETADNYTVTYPGVEAFSDTDIETLKELLALRKTEYNPETIVMTEKARSQIEKLLDVKSEEADSAAFLSKLIKDFNHITGR